MKIKWVVHRVFFAGLLLAQCSAWADGICRNGAGARSMGMGGADVAWAVDPLGAMAANPGGLGFLESSAINAGVLAGFTEGTFDKPGVSNGHLSDSPRALPEGAIGAPVGKLAGDISFGAGLSFVPEALMLADWKYVDPPGGLGGNVSYGMQRHDSEIVVLRSALGVGASFGKMVSLGVSVGLLYNENRLRSPYTFQNMDVNPGLNGAKTLLDLHTTGFGWDVTAGAVLRPTDNLQFGLSYKSESTVSTDGDANGDAYAQFGVPQGTATVFHYDANVKNKFPQQVSLGMSWKFHPGWRAAAQVDWLNWADAFKTLPVSLSNGNNAAVNGAVGAKFEDRIPLDWKDRFVYRGGLEFNVTEDFVLRGGYCYGQSPVPNSTLIPMTAAIMEHTFTAGAGYQWKCYRFDAAYQYDLPIKRHVGTSSLRSGEYSNTSIEVGAHWFVLTVGVVF